MNGWTLRTMGVGLAVSLAMGTSFAHPHRAPRPELSAAVPLALAQALDLSAEQRERIEQLRREELKQAIALKARIRLLQVEMAELLDSETPERELLGAKIEEVAALEAQLRKLALDTRLDCKAALTSEQLERLEDLHGRPLRFRFGDFLRRGPADAPAAAAWRGFGN